MGRPCARVLQAPPANAWTCLEPAWSSRGWEWLSDATRTGYCPAVRFLVLGPLEVEATPEPVALGGRKQKLVLAHLLRRPNGWVSTETLIDDVWGEEPPGAAKGSLQSYVSNLRKALGAERLETGAGGYRLVVGPGELDALEFEQTSARANAEVDGDPREASDLFRRALGLWRGSAFSDLADEPSLLGEIGRLEEERLQAIEGRIDADLALGRHTEVVAELDDLTRRWPLREHLWAQRMLALYRAERPAEALAAYREARSTLVDELGVEPGRPLQQLNERILLQDPELDLPTASAGPRDERARQPVQGAAAVPRRRPAGLPRSRGAHRAARRHARARCPPRHTHRPERVGQVQRRLRRAGPRRCGSATSATGGRSHRCVRAPIRSRSSTPPWGARSRHRPRATTAPTGTPGSWKRCCARCPRTGPGCCS